MINENIINDLREYLKDHYIPKEAFFSSFESPLKDMASNHSEFICMADIELFSVSNAKLLRSVSDEASDYIKKNKKSGGFPHALEKKRKEKGLTPAELYKKANVDKRQYSRLMGPEGRHPSMNTVISFAFALRLVRSEFDELLQTAGYALSNSSSRDVCIMYCLENSIYDIDDVNALLFAIGIPPLTRE